MSERVLGACAFRWLHMHLMLPAMVLRCEAWRVKAAFWYRQAGSVSLISVEQLGAQMAAHGILFNRCGRAGGCHRHARQEQGG